MGAVAVCAYQSSELISEVSPTGVSKSGGASSTSGWGSKSGGASSTSGWGSKSGGASSTSGWGSKSGRVRLRERVSRQPVSRKRVCRRRRCTHRACPRTGGQVLAHFSAERQPAGRGDRRQNRRGLRNGPGCVGRSRGRSGASSVAYVPAVRVPWIRTATGVIAPPTARRTRVYAFHYAGKRLLAPTHPDTSGISTPPRGHVDGNWPMRPIPQGRRRSGPQLSARRSSRASRAAPARCARPRSAPSSEPATPRRRT